MTQNPTAPTASPTDPDKALTAAEADAIARGHGNPVKIVDPASDLVDEDPMHVTEPDLKEQNLVFAFSGANLGGQTLVVCMGGDGCGSLLQEDQETKHRAWHLNGRP